MHIAVRIALFAGLALAPGLSFPQSGTPPSPLATRTLPDSALQKLANDYFGDYSNKDLQAMNMWQRQATSHTSGQDTAK